MLTRSANRTHHENHSLLYSALLLVLLSFAAQLASAKSLCEQPQAFKDMRHSGMPLSQYKFSIFDHRDVVFLGESHFTINQETYFQVLKSARARMGNRACFLMEFPALGSVEQLFSFILNEKIAVSPNAESARANRRTYDYYEPISRAAKKLGYKVFVIDSPRLQTADQGNGPDLNERDAYMAEKIEQLFASGECDKALSLNGKAHLTPLEPNRSTLKENVRNFGLKTASVSMHSPTDWNVLPRYELSISGVCEAEEFVATGEMTVLPVKGLEKNTPMYPDNFAMKGAWDDFDIALIDSY